jgi:hypothetical protein
VTSKSSTIHQPHTSDTPIAMANGVRDRPASLSGEFSEVINCSPRVVSQRLTNSGIQQSPVLTAQRKMLASIINGNSRVAQRAAEEQGSDSQVAPRLEQHSPHEIQRAQGGVQPTSTVQMNEGMPINDDPGLEHEADVMGAKAASMISTAATAKADVAKTSSTTPNPLSSQCGSVQRVVEFLDDSKGKQTGYTRTTRFRDEPTDEQKSLYYDMHERQNKKYVFDDADALHRHLLSSGATDVPKVSDLMRGGAYDIFDDVVGNEAFNKTGASAYLKYTQPDMNNWQRFMQLHRNNALQLVPSGDEHSDAREEIGTIYDDNLLYAAMLDHHEESEALTLTDSSSLTGLTGDETELSEPLEVKKAAEAMYAVSTKARGELFSRGPSVVVPRFGGNAPGGMGLWAYIAFQKGDSFPEGSSASGSYTSLPWEAPLKKRRTPHNENVYIRGHLLNDHLGGPAASYNLVPLVGIDVPGAPNSNDAHSSLVEGQARAAFKQISKEEDGSKSPTISLYSGLRYLVQVSSFGGHDVSQITTTLNLEKLRAAVWLSMASNAENLNKPKAAITLTEFKAFLGNGSFEAEKQQRYVNNWTARAKPVFSTVWDTDNGDKPVEEILALIDDNIGLWNWEAVHLPKSLSYSFVYTNVFGSPASDSVAVRAVPAGPVRNVSMKYKS